MDNNFRITEILKDKGMTITELATIIGVSRVGLSKAINGNTTVATLNKIAVALGVPVSELFEKSKTGVIVCPHCGRDITVKTE